MLGEVCATPIWTSTSRPVRNGESTSAYACRGRCGGCGLSSRSAVSGRSERHQPHRLLHRDARRGLNLKRHAEIELRFSANGQHLSSLARVMDIRPGKGVGIEFLRGDPRMDREFRELIERLSLGTSSKDK